MNIDIEKMLAECVPGGASCDPQVVADNIRRYCGAWMHAAAMQPTDAWPLTEEAKELLPANPFSAQPKRPNESGSTLCEVRWLVETPAGWLGAYDIEAFEAYKHMIQDDESN